MIINGRELTESERLEWLARHRQDDELVAVERDDVFSAVYWMHETTEIRHHAPDPLATHPTDDRSEEDRYIDEHYDWSAQQWDRTQLNGPEKALAIAIVVACYIFAAALLYAGWKWLAVNGYFWWVQ